MDRSLDDLPSEIKLDIFSRLPAESVLVCRLVCKPWANLLELHNNPHFANMHLRHDSGVMSFVFINKHDGRLYCADDRKEPNCLRLRRVFNLRLAVMYAHWNIVGSCNGLICLRVEAGYLFNEGKEICICNPVTRELVTLPKIEISNWRDSSVVGFGYLPATNDYKVVRTSKGHVQVYTIGSRSGWRNVGETTYNLTQYCDKASICLDGFVYWFIKSGSAIVFDLAKEEFRWDNKLDGENLKVFGFTKTGEVLRKHNWWNYMERYNPKTKTTTPIEISGEKNFFLDYRELIVYHVNSFVSLEALGEVGGSTICDEDERLISYVAHEYIYQPPPLGYIPTEIYPSPCPFIYVFSPAYIGPKPYRSQSVTKYIYPSPPKYVYSSPPFPSYLATGYINSPPPPPSPPVCIAPKVYPTSSSKYIYSPPPPPVCVAPKVYPSSSSKYVYSSPPLPVGVAPNYIYSSPPPPSYVAPEYEYPPPRPPKDIFSPSSYVAPELFVCSSPPPPSKSYLRTSNAPQVSRDCCSTKRPRTK